MVIKNKNTLLLLFFCTVLMMSFSVSANEVPSSVNLSCGESYQDTFTLGEDIDKVEPTIISSSDVGYMISPSYKSSNNRLSLNFIRDTGYECSGGSQVFTLKYYNSTGEEISSRDINLTIDENIFKLGTRQLQEGETLKIGDQLLFQIDATEEEKIKYTLNGCGQDKTDVLDEDETFKISCDDTNIEIKLLHSYGGSFNFAEFEVYSSESGYTLTKSNKSVDEEKSGCELGVSTLGAEIKRGSTLSVETRNINTGEYIPNVVVRVLDQEGNIEPLSGKSDSTGFYSTSLKEDYERGIIVKLQKDGCEPTNKVLEFDRSYTAYKDKKEEEQKEQNLVMNISDTYTSGKEVTEKVSNALGDPVKGVNIKLTKPNDESMETTTDENGKFSFKPDKTGKWKIQGGKDGYNTTKLMTFDVDTSEEYRISTDIKGESRREPKKGDTLQFTLRNKNGSRLDIDTTATFGGKEIQFMEGVSDPVEFSGKSMNLEVPSEEGYKETTMQVREKEKDFSTILWVVGVLVGLVIIFFIGRAIFKNRGMSMLSIGSSKGYADAMNTGSKIKMGGE